LHHLRCMILPARWSNPDLQLQIIICRWYGNQTNKDWLFTCHEYQIRNSFQIIVAVEVFIGQCGKFRLWNAYYWVNFWLELRKRCRIYLRNVMFAAAYRHACWFDCFVFTITQNVAIFSWVSLSRLDEKENNTSSIKLHSAHWFTYYQM